MAYNDAYSYDADSIRPDDSISRRGDNASVRSSGMISPAPDCDDDPADSHVSHSTFKNDPPTTPPSRHTSVRSSQPQTPTTFVPSKKERVRYSWQSIHEDEPNKPRIHVVKIVSNTATASAASPQGEALAFSLSPAGKRIAAYNSARLFVFQTAALPVNVSHEYALRRRPLAVEICDEANVLAVLVDEHTVNVYDLSHNNARRVRTVRTDLPTSTIALSSTGGLLAAAYEGGVEIFSLAPNALITDRRAVRAPKMDKLVFSQDDSTLLGTTTRIFTSSTLVVSVPIFPSTSSGEPSHQELQEAWCTGMLEPQNIKNSSHATFMREDGSMANDTLFAWNGLEDTFGLLHTQDMLYSQVDFPVAISPPLSTCGGLGAAIHHCPSIDEHGKIVAMIVNDRTVRLYIVPNDAEDGTTKVEAHSIDHELDEEYGCPFTDLRWVHSRLNLPASAHSPHQIRGRLVVTSPGSLLDADQAELSVQDVEGGRIILFDFDPQFAGQPGQTFVLHVGKAPPVTLEEEKMDVADEIALVRRRTVTSTRSNTLGKKTPSLGRAATTVSRRQESSPYRNGSPAGSMQQLAVHTSPWRNRRVNSSVISLSADATRSLPDLLESSELAAESLEQPYTQGAPRSYMSIERATTAANAHRFQTLEEQEAEADHPGDLPLPAYTELPNQPLPGKYRALAGLDIPSHGRFVQQTSTPPSAIATAPPTFHDHRCPSPASTLSPPAVPPHMSSYHQNISPISSLAQSATRSDYNPSPLTARSGTLRTLRTQSSWETVNTNALSTPHVPSTLRSQPSWESGGTLSFFSPEMSQGNRTVPTSPEHMRAPQMMQGLGLQDFRHSLLIPQERFVEDRPRTTASDPQAHDEPTNHIQHRPPHVNAMQAVNYAAANNLMPTSTNTSERTSTGAVSAISASSSTGTIPPRPATSAGNVGYQVTAWFPPAAPTSIDDRPSLAHRSKSAIDPSSRPVSNTRALHTSHSTRTGRGSSTNGEDDSPNLRRSKSVGTGRKAWFAKKKQLEDRIGGEVLPTIGRGVREDLLHHQEQGKRCVVM
ncbi:hypothetical protein D6C84_06166 [Aureobasidium pullulans]|uniref:DUF7165 domain-containing protein n=1 Tax=Aureobasidium pullulans TaxID=5580 RepID=A0A4V4L0Q5_AURPU|nr:hypothetical protein D6C84_06166 [Aureobasidium pullulans]